MNEYSRECGDVASCFLLPASCFLLHAAADHLIRSSVSGETRGQHSIDGGLGNLVLHQGLKGPLDLAHNQNAAM